nr:hypothetical protein [Tanacetum cinerariifolium]
MAQLPVRAQRHLWLRYEVKGYTEEVVQDFEHRLVGIFSRRVHRVQVLDFEGMTEEMSMDIGARLSMRHKDADRVVVFTSHVWRRLFDIRGLLVRELMLEFFSTCRFDDLLLDLDTKGVLSFQLGGAKCTMSWRQFILAIGLHTIKEIDTYGFRSYWSMSSRMVASKGDLRGYWVEISCHTPPRRNHKA